MSQVDLLYRLQQIDDEIRDGKKRLSQVLSLQKESSQLINAGKRMENAQAELEKWRRQQNDLNLELNSLIEKYEREEIRLYSGTITNPKELADIQHELEALKRRRDGLEDELLEAMINLEDAQNEAEAAQKELARIQADWTHNQADLQTEQTVLIAKINELTNMRDQHTLSLTTDSIKAYENAIRRAGLTAVVPLKNSRCGGCQVSVPANLVKRADEGGLVICDSCTRVLCPV